MANLSTKTLVIILSWKLARAIGLKSSILLAYDNLRINATKFEFKPERIQL